MTESIKALIEAHSAEYNKTIQQYHWSLIPTTQLHAAHQQITRSQYAIKAAQNDPAALRDAIINAGVLGLDLTDGKRQGWLVPRRVGGNLRIALQVGYKGHEAIAQRLGIIDRVAVRVVRDADQFDWSGDDRDVPEHKADWFGERGAIIGAYAVTYYPNNGTQTVVAKIADIYHNHRDKSDSWQSYQQKLEKGENPMPPPWVTFEEEMVKKTMVYVASKLWPANIRDAEVNGRILETLHQVDTQDFDGMRGGYRPEHREAFERYVSESNGLGLYLLRLYLGNEPWTSIHGAIVGDIERGGKMKWRATVADLDKQGSDTLDALKDAITKDDGLGVLELIEGQDDTTMAMVRHVLTDGQWFVIERFQHEAAE